MLMMDSLIKRIGSIKIANFQSHKSTLIDFANHGLTVITGPSDSGKSAVIRALRWVFYNVPQGSDFITVGEDKCVVSVIFEGGTVVERIRTRGGINRYTVDGQVFEGFGTGVPIEVQEATGIRKLQIGDIHFMLNLSEQLDGPFLGKSVPGSARAKVLGKLAGTEEIDFAGKEVGTDLYRANRQKEGITKDIESNLKALDEYSWIPDRERQLATLQIIIENTKRNQRSVETLQDLSRQYRDLSQQAVNLQTTLKRLLPIDQGLNAVDIAQIEIHKRNNLTSLYQDYEKVMDLTSESICMLEDLKEIESANNCLVAAQEKLTKGKTLLNCWNRYLLIDLQKDANQVKIRGLANQYEAVFPLLQAAAESAETATKVSNIYELYSQANHGVVSMRKTVECLLSLDNVMGTMELATGKNFDLGVIEELQKKYSDWVNTESFGRSKITTLEAEVEALDAEYITFMSDLGTCPTCGGEINIEKLREVI